MRHGTIRTFWVCAIGCCFLGCTPEKKEQRDSGTVQVPAQKEPTPKKSQEGLVTLGVGTERQGGTNLSDPEQLDRFVQALGNDGEALKDFEEQLSKGAYSKVELLQLKYHLSAHAGSSDSLTVAGGESVDWIRTAAGNLFHTVAHGTDRVLEHVSPNALKVETLINDRLDLLSRKSGYNANALEDGVKKKMREFMGGDQSLLYEKMTRAGIYNAAGLRQAQEGIAGTDDRDSIVEYMARYMEMAPREILLLEKVPSFERYLNERQARENGAARLDPEIAQYLKSGNASGAFTKLLEHHVKIASLNAQSQLNKAKRARAAFHELNPTWDSDDGAVGNTYFDEKDKGIFLPLGKLSFADRVVSHDPGFPKGGFSEGALGEPDLPKDPGNFDPRFCSIGIGGVLVLEFIDNALTDVNGPDLYVFEIGKVEPTVLEISKDGKQWIRVGEIQGGTAMVDIHDVVGPGETFTYVRLTDLRSESGIPGADVDAVAAIGGAVRLQLDSSVLFEFGQYELRPEARELLEGLIPELQRLGKGSIVVEGHTDNVGGAAANRKLSEQRAQSVGALLRSLMGKDADHFSWQTMGYGDSRPVAPNDNDENRQKNRRVELLVLPK